MKVKASISPTKKTRRAFKGYRVAGGPRRAALAELEKEGI